jgi:oligopeptidase B
LSDGALRRPAETLGAGHGGSSGRYDALREKAHDWAFLLTQLGIKR